jgi:hypothetical protein
MRTLLAVMLFAGAISMQSPNADAARKSMRSGYLPYAASPYKARRAYGTCQARARADDPDGAFAGFPCWARSAFGQGRR